MLNPCGCSKISDMISLPGRPSNEGKFLPICQNVFRLSIIIFGAILLAPLVSRLPMVGWDWYYVFYGAESRLIAYPPYAKYFLDLLTWMDWRSSLALLNSISLFAIAVSTWRHGGRLGSIFLALLSAPTWYLIWVGQVDGLVLLGMITGIFPLALMKPQISFWHYLKDRKWAIVISTFVVLSLFVWPFWISNFNNATFDYPAAFGWKVVGWPVALLGILLLLGAGNDSDRLMSAGALVSPYLMPYHVVLLMPIIGRAKGARKLLLFFSSWLLVLGVGLSGLGKLASLIFPILCYACIHSYKDFVGNLRAKSRIPSTAFQTFCDWRESFKGAAKKIN